MRGPISLTGFAAEAPILGRLDALFAAVSPRFVIPAGSLAPGWPEEESEPIALRTEMAERRAEGESTDPAWEAVVLLTRQDGDEATMRRLIAVGLVLQQEIRSDLLELCGFVRGHGAATAESCGCVDQRCGGGCRLQGRRPAVVWAVRRADGRGRVVLRSA
ncbi:hypothetical protein [Salinispora arenicola]|uniref:hypothetical protein n=1 Tax=Salinispora arenicola TaxID=168697 RepID=UPI00037B3DA9|nr:hypothetical protein [Salinispora arenicola]